MALESNRSLKNKLQKRRAVVLNQKSNAASACVGLFFWLDRLCLLGRDCESRYLTLRPVRVDIFIERAISRFEAHRAGISNRSAIESKSYVAPDGAVH